MSESVSNNDDSLFSRRVMTSFIQIAALVLLITYCLMIMAPFAGIVVWGIVLAVAVYPLHLRVSGMLGDRPKTSATIITLVALTLILVPGWLIATSTLDTARHLQQDIAGDGVIVDPPTEKVREWPVIGEKTYEIWSEASENLQATVEKYQPQVRAAGEWFLKAALGVGAGVLHFVASFIIAGILLMFGREGYATTSAIAGRIVPGRGEELTNLMTSTIRSVTNGVLGVAAIQAGLAGIGFAMIGLPAAGVFTLVILIAAIIQVPALLIMLPLIGWVFSYASTGAAIVFAIYSIIVALSDNVLKPMLLGRGVNLPVLVVLIGAIGGMIRFGVIGLFLGAVILGLGYQIIRTWLGSDYFKPEPQVPGEAGSA